MAGWPVNFSMSVTDGPLPMKLRPCQPSVSHGMTEAGPPDRRPVAGWCTPSAVLVSRTEYALFITFRNPCSSRPLTTR
jgi:hypothetical protein